MLLALPLWLLSSGCRPADPAAGAEATVTVQAVVAFPNMLEARFQAGADPIEAAWIEVEVDGELLGFGAATGRPSAQDPEGQDLVAFAPGLPAPASVVVTAYVRTAQGEQALAPITAQTGALPDIGVAPVVQGQPAAAWSFTTVGGQTWAPLLLSPAGQPAWWSAAEPEGTAVVRLRPLPDGSGLVYARFPVLAAGDEEAVPTGFVHRGWDGTELSFEARPAAHHDFVFLPEGGRAWIESEDREVDGVLVRGDRVLRSFPDGAEQVLWSAWDHLEYDPDRVWEIAGIRWWTLANALAVDEAHDRLLLSLKNLDAVVAIDLDTGAQRWRLSAEGGDLSLLPPATPFVSQHGMEPTDAGFLLFDNSGGEGGSSRVLALELDEEAGTASVSWAIDTDPPHHGLVLGDVRATPDGGTRIAWSALGRLEDRDAQRQWRGSVQVAEAAYLGFLQVEEALLPPP